MGLFRKQGCISIDRFHSNTLSRCFDNGKIYEMLEEKERGEEEAFFEQVSNWLS